MEQTQLFLSFLPHINLEFVKNNIVMSCLTGGAGKKNKKTKFSAMCGGRGGVPFQCQMVSYRLHPSCSLGNQVNTRKMSKGRGGGNSKMGTLETDAKSFKGYFSTDGVSQLAKDFMSLEEDKKHQHTKKIFYQFFSPGINIYKFSHIYVYIYIYIYIYIYTHTHTHTHTSVCLKNVVLYYML